MYFGASACRSDNHAAQFSRFKMRELHARSPSACLDEHLIDLVMGHPIRHPVVHDLVSSGAITAVEIDGVVRYDLKRPTRLFYRGNENGLRPRDCYTHPSFAHEPLLKRLVWDVSYSTRSPHALHPLRLPRQHLSLAPRRGRPPRRG